VRAKGIVVERADPAVHLRSALESDGPFLTEMLVEAFAWRPGAPQPSVSDALARPEIGRYVKEWPRCGDFGLIAEQSGSVGAIWFRHFSADDAGYGFIADDVPEITMAVVPSWRHRGVGRLLLATLIDQARQQGLKRLSLSVEPDNFALVLYRSLGFQVVGQVGGAMTMAVQL
jgi:GNAT superfamily N-acetyltransferase